MNQLQTANVEKEQALKDKDEMLLLTKARIIKLEDIINKLQKDLAENSKKTERSHKFARGLLQQRKDHEHEIKRLNKILETSANQQHQQQHQHSSKSDAVKRLQHKTGASSQGQQKSPAKQSRDKDNTGQKVKPSNQQRNTSDRKKEDRAVKKEDRTVRKEDRVEVERKAKETKATERRDHIQQKQEGNEGVSLTKEELKEHIVFLKEQTEAYESDFRKERSDRERAVGQLEYVKDKLDRTRQKLGQSKHRNPTLCGHCVASKPHCIVHVKHL
ncbi:uncharacterized protein [Amphiura filiformis]|uniref:uncharacterized protein n=1 Tax=Amphiura filiformis TaxID=82378 RepID=UPI003B21EDFC